MEWKWEEGQGGRVERETWEWRVRGAFLVGSFHGARKPRRLGMERQETFDGQTRCSKAANEGREERSRRKQRGETRKGKETPSNTDLALSHPFLQERRNLIARPRTLWLLRLSGAALIEVGVLWGGTVGRGWRA